VTKYICTINLFLLFDNTTGMTHLKIPKKQLSQIKCRFKHVTHTEGYLSSTTG